MSKLVKKYVARDIANRLQGVNDAVVANIVGMSGEENFGIRKTLREKGISLMVVKRTMAARATEGTSLRSAFENQSGSLAVVWGCEDFCGVDSGTHQVGGFGNIPEARDQGGVMDGEALTADQVKKVSKWPSRQEQISMLVGQILSREQPSLDNWLVLHARLLVRSEDDREPGRGWRVIVRYYGTWLNSRFCFSPVSFVS